MEGREGQHKAAHDVAAARRQMALATVALPGLRIVHVLASEIPPGQRQFLDKDNSMSEGLFFQFWILTQTA